MRPGASSFVSHAAGPCGLTLLAALSSGACALHRPPVAEVLEHRDQLSREHEDALRALSPDTALSSLDALALELHLNARELPADPGAQAEAARALYHSADARILGGLLLYITESPQVSMKDILDAEWSVRDAIAGEVLSLSEAGLAHAERALSLAPDLDSALLLRGVHITLATYGTGRFRALTSGRGKQAWLAVLDIRRSVDPGFEAATPLRLEGRVLTQVPWPWRDPKRAEDCLRRAVELAPVPVNLLYHGDALLALGRSSEAAAAWREAVAAKAGEWTGHAAPLHRALAAVRLNALSQSD